MKVEKARIGARGIDSYAFSGGGTAAQAKRLRETGIEFVFLYLGVATQAIFDLTLRADLAVMFVTLAAKLDGAAAVKQLGKLKAPAGASVFLDIEGEGICPPKMDTGDLITRENVWTKAVTEAGYLAGYYIGSPQPHTADELWRLPGTRYWKAPSRVIDRHGIASDGPACGFCCYQLWHGDQALMGQWWPDAKDPKRVLVDVDFVQADHLGRVPNWVRL